MQFKSLQNKHHFSFAVFKIEIMRFVYLIQCGKENHMKQRLWILMKRVLTNLIFNKILIY